MRKFLQRDNEKGERQLGDILPLLDAEVIKKYAEIIEKSI